MNFTRTALLGSLFVLACIPMKTLRGSSLTFLTKEGAKATFNRPSSVLGGEVQQIFQDRGFNLAGRNAVSPTNVVLFFRGARTMVTQENATAQEVYDTGAQLGSWFAVRLTEDNGKTTVAIYGKPVVGGREVCSDGDSGLNDVQYRCTDTIVRQDWPASQLVEGREETQVISQVLATLTERLPEH